jgi:hypothetical protein
MEEKINNEKEKIGKTLSEIRENINKIQRWFFQGSLKINRGHFQTMI